MRRCKILSVLVLCLLPVKALPQPRFKAALHAVEKSAFYCIDLPYEVQGGARPDLADVRIVDDQGKEVAWLLREEGKPGSGTEFIPLPMEVHSLPRRTELLITGSGESLSSFVLKIKNTDVSKEAALLGSNDSVKWFAVKDRFMLSRRSSLNQTEALIDVSFPLSDYKLYKLSLNDSLAAPLNIIAAGRMKAGSHREPYRLEVPPTGCRILTEGKRTVIELALPFKFRVECLDFYISSPRYFNRNIRLLQPSGGIATATLSNTEGYPQRVSMEGYGDTLRLSVANGDDRPLTIDSVKAYVRRYSLIAALEKGVHYTLTYGDSQAVFPQYDLSFGRQIPDEIDYVTLARIEQTPAKPQVEDPGWLLFLKSYGIWLVILLITLQILYAVRKIMK